MPRARPVEEGTGAAQYEADMADQAFLRHRQLRHRQLVRPAGSAAAPGLPRRRGSRSAMIRGGRVFREARARRVHHQRVHQSSPAPGADTLFTRPNLLDEPLADALLLRVGRLEAVLERVADLLHGELLLLCVELVEQ